MSYCRWSSDDFQCDVYVYESCQGGFDTHVAGQRYVFKEPLPPPVNLSQDNIQEWMARHNKVSETLDHDSMIEIGLPHDGESFNDSTPGECADRLESLRAMGYVVPQYAIDALREEQGDVQP